MLDLPKPELEHLAEVLTESEKLAHLRELAKHLAAERIDGSEAMAHMRGRSADIKAAAQNPELRNFLLEAKRGKVTPLDIVRPGQRLSSRSAPFLLEGLVMPNCTNLIVGREKKGKTSLLIAWIAAWHFGCETFINQAVHGEIPPVFIIGPDMPEQDWNALLRQYHLLDEDDLLPEDGPIKGVIHKGHQIYLDRSGIDLIEELAAEHPGAIFLFDSYSALVSGLGIREEGAEFADPLLSLQAALAPHNITILLIHHSAANRDTGKATSRGSTALPAASTQKIFLESPTNEEDDPRIQIRTKGRERDFKALLRKEEPDGHWICISQGAGLVEQQNRERTISKLKGLQRKVFDALLTLRQDQPNGSDYWGIAEHIGWGSDAKAIDRVRGPIAALCGRGLVMEMPVKAVADEDGGRPRCCFRIRQAVADPCRQEFSGVSGVPDDQKNAPETQNLMGLRAAAPETSETPETLHRKGSGEFQASLSSTGEGSNSPLTTESRFMEFLESSHTQSPAATGHLPGLNQEQPLPF